MGIPRPTRKKFGTKVFRKIIVGTVSENKVIVHKIMVLMVLKGNDPKALKMKF